MMAVVCMGRYQDYQASDIPVVQEDGVRVRVMAGSHRGTIGPIEMRNPGLLMDVTLTKGSTFKQEVQALLYHSLLACNSSCLPLTCCPSFLWFSDPRVWGQWTGFDSNVALSVQMLMGCCVSGGAPPSEAPMMLCVMTLGGM